MAGEQRWTFRRNVTESEAWPDGYITYGNIVERSGRIVGTEPTTVDGADEYLAELIDQFKGDFAALQKSLQRGAYYELVPADEAAAPEATTPSG